MKQYVSIFLIGLLAAFGANAETLKGQGEAIFSVKATGHTVEGTVALEPFEATVKEVDGDKLLSLEIEAEVLKMSTDHKKRDKEMYHHLGEEDHPRIHGRVSDVSLSALMSETEEPVIVPIKFKMAGVEVDKSAEVLEAAENEEGIQVSVGFDVLQTEHFIKPIRKFGFLKVSDTVHVEVHLTLTP